MATIQYPVFPWEITDIIIDHLHSDFRSLGVFSTVCSEWLIRSRFHMFSTVQLWPWRASRFFDLAKSRSCTFTHHIRRIEFDDSKVKERTQDVRLTLQRHDETVLFNEAMAQSDILCFSQVKSMRVENVDWTALPPTQQAKLRERLAKFSKLRRLEFQGVMFHDLREVIRVVSSFPSLRQLSAHISFLKYLDYAIASAGSSHLPSNVQTIELGTDDGIPVIMSCLSANGVKPHIFALKLQNIKCCHLLYISAAMRSCKPNLQHVSLGFSWDALQAMRMDDIVNAVDLSCLSQLRTLSIDGLRLQEINSPSILEVALVPILQRIESSFLESIDLKFLLSANAALGCFNWRGLERVLLVHHFFGLRLVRVVIVLEEAGSTCLNRKFVERWIRRAMSDLNSREILAVEVI